MKINLPVYLSLLISLLFSGNLFAEIVLSRDVLVAVSESFGSSSLERDKKIFLNIQNKNKEMSKKGITSVGTNELLVFKFGYLSSLAKPDLVGVYIDGSVTPVVAVINPGKAINTSL